MSVPENPFFSPIKDSDRSQPPLDQHLQSLTIEKTRMGKVYDWILKGQCEAILGISGEDSPSDEMILLMLLCTEGYIDLPNRKRLAALVEEAMAKEAGKPEPVRYKSHPAPRMFDGKNLDPIPEPNLYKETKQC